MSSNKLARNPSDHPAICECSRCKYQKEKVKAENGKQLSNRPGSSSKSTISNYLMDSRVPTSIAGSAANSSPRPPASGNRVPSLRDNPPKPNPSQGQAKEKSVQVTATRNNSTSAQPVPKPNTSQGREKEKRATASRQNSAPAQPGSGNRPSSGGRQLSLPNHSTRYGIEGVVPSARSSLLSRQPGSVNQVPSLTNAPTSPAPSQLSRVEGAIQSNKQFAISGQPGSGNRVSGQRSYSMGSIPFQGNGLYGRGYVGPPGLSNRVPLSFFEDPESRIPPPPPGYSYLIRDQPNEMGYFMNSPYLRDLPTEVVASALAPLNVALSIMPRAHGRGCLCSVCFPNKPNNSNLERHPPAPLGTLKVSSDPMCARQLYYRTLSPDQRKAQDDWARKYLGVCPQGYSWKRENGAWYCQGWEHLVTDELLAEGRGAMYENRMLPPHTRWAGPVYPKSDPLYFQELEKHLPPEKKARMDSVIIRSKPPSGRSRW